MTTSLAAPTGQQQLELPPGTQTYSANWSVANADGSQVSVPVTVVPIGRMVNGQPMLNDGMGAFQGMVAEMMMGKQQGGGAEASANQSKSRLINSTIVDLFKTEPLDPTTVKRYIQIHVTDMTHRNLANLFFMMAQKGLNVESFFQNLTELAKKIRDFPVSISLQGLAHLLNCCRALTSETHGVPFLCVAVADKLRAAPRSPNMRVCELALAIKGMSAFSSHLPEVQSLIDSITIRAEHSDEVPNASQMSDCFYGLQGMSNEETSVNRLLVCLKKKLESMPQTVQWTAGEISRALFGCVGLTCGHQETQDLITLLSEKVVTTVDDLTGSDLALALFGCQSMSADHLSVRNLCTALLTHVVKIQTLEPGEAGMALYGCQGFAMQGFEDGTKLRSHMVRLAEASAQSPETYGKCELYRSFLIAGVRWPFDSVPERLGVAPQRTEIEKTSMMLIQGLFMGASNEVLTDINTTLSGFDACITVRTPEHFLNIEFDTGSHKRFLQRRFNQQRDEVLLNLGYKVVRVAVEGKDWSSIEQELKSIVGLAQDDETKAANRARQNLIRHV